MRRIDMMRGIREVVAKRIKVKRNEKSWTQQQLADASGLHRSYISRIEIKDVDPTIGTVEKIARALHVRYIELFKGRLTLPGKVKNSRKQQDAPKKSRSKK